jgi:proline racemase
LNNAPKEGKWLVEYGPYKNAVIPEVEGDAFITGRSEFWIDPNDSLNEGFLVSSVS